MKRIKLTALPCICADVFDGTDIIRPGGEALNFAAHASRFDEMDVTLLGIVGKDKYAEAIMDSISKLDIEKNIDFFMISGSEELLPKFRELSCKYDCLFNISLAERGSVTYFKGQEFRVQAVKVDTVIDTTGCGDSYHAGFVCSYMLENDIEKAMRVGSEIAAETLKHYGGF